MISPEANTTDWASNGGSHDQRSGLTTKAASFLQRRQSWPHQVRFRSGTRFARPFPWGHGFHGWQDMSTSSQRGARKRRSDSSTRLTAQAAQVLKRAIDDAEGAEVFAIAGLDDSGTITEVEIQARGRKGSVAALFQRARPGQVVVHNHPSGDLTPSEADLQLASHHGQDGVGMVIVNNSVSRDLWVVEPLCISNDQVPEAAVHKFFSEDLPRVLRHHEDRPAQLEMALDVLRCMNDGGSLVAEAGTGTGKSLAYLVPAAMWSRANKRIVAVATYTLALQDQLVRADIPLMHRAGLDVSFAVMKGRSNYLCLRKLEAAIKPAVLPPPTTQLTIDKSTASSGEERRPEYDPEISALHQIRQWAGLTRAGLRSEISFPVPGDLWDRLDSDASQCLGIKCSSYESCFYHRARRNAAASSLLILNHSLLMADLEIKRQSGGWGILPHYDRVVIDEAHHLEDATTSSMTSRLASARVRRSCRSLLGHMKGNRKKPGTLDRIESTFAGTASPFAEPARLKLGAAIHRARELTSKLYLEGPFLLEALSCLLGLENYPVSLPHRDSAGADEASPPTRDHLGSWQEHVEQLAQRLSETVRALDAITTCIESTPIHEKLLAPLLELNRLRTRMNDQANCAALSLEEQDGWCRWLEPEAHGPAGVLCRAPVDVGDVIADLLSDGIKGRVYTSATLSVRDKFDLFLGSVGIDEVQQERDTVIRRWISPFDYPNQVLLGLPRDIAPPGATGYIRQMSLFIHRALQVSRGGAFILCTSFDHVDVLADMAQKTLGHRYPVMRQGSISRTQILRRFASQQGSVLFGTASFWEGVSIRGRALRLVIIPKLPFDVPTDPLIAARHDRLRQQGQNPFMVHSLPRAALKLRQGFGRLIRSQNDVGAVILLDRRIHDRWYGRWFLSALPPATKVAGPSRLVLERLDGFLNQPLGVQ